MRRKCKKLSKLISNPVEKKMALDRMEDHKACLLFKEDLLAYCNDVFEDFENLVNLVSIGGVNSKMRSGSDIDATKNNSQCDETNLSDTSIDFEITDSRTSEKPNLINDNGGGLRVFSLVLMFSIFLKGNFLKLKFLCSPKDSSSFPLLISLIALF